MKIIILLSLLLSGGVRVERHAAQHGRRPGAGPVPDDQLEARQQDRQDEEWRPVRHLSQV